MQLIYDIALGLLFWGLMAGLLATNMVADGLAELFGMAEDWTSA